MTLEARVVLRVGALALDAQISVRSGETVVLVGPNGAGKTTWLRALAGLRRLDDGRVVLDGEVLEDARAGVFVEPERRSIGFVFQDYLLFPHLSALENVAFGARARGAAKRDAHASARAWLDRMGLASRAGDRPSALSGGQAQRVALARALATSPRMLLLDEPLAALDAAARVDVRRELRRHLAEFEGTRIVVTHDPLEAIALADRLVVLEQGRVVQVGSVSEVCERPRSRYVAELLGVNLFRGAAQGRRIDLAGGGALVAPHEHAGEVFAVVHPRAVALHRARPEGSARNVWSGVVAGLEPAGDGVRVRVAAAPTIVAEVTPASVAELRLADGGEIWASVKAAEISVYPV